jgi:Flp pilus assembly protein TadD
VDFVGESLGCQRSEMNKKTKASAWHLTFTITVIMIVFMSGCYLKNNKEPTFQNYNQGKSSSSLTDKNLNKFASSVRKVDGQAQSHYKIAMHFQRNRRHKLAIEELKNAVKCDPTMAKAYNAIGVSYDKLKKYDQAIRSYQLALAIDSNLDYVHNNIGYSYLLVDNLDSAIESFQRATELNGKSKRYRNNLALAYVISDRYDLAIAQLKGLEGGPHAAETVSKLARGLGKKDFEKQIVSALQTFASEKNLVAKAKLAPSKSAVIQKNISDQETEFRSKKPIVIRRKIEYSPSVLEPEVIRPDPIIKGLAKEKSSRKKIQTGFLPVSESQNQQHNATAGDIQHLKYRVVTRKQPIRNEDSLQKQDKEFDNYFDEPLHLSAFEIASEPSTEKPRSVLPGLQDSDATTSIKTIKKETAHRPKPKIKPKVIEVADVFKTAGKELEYTMPVKSAGKLEIVGLSARGSTTRKISPVYVASALPSEKTEGKGLSIIVVSPSRKDKKIKRTAASTEKIKTEKRGQDIVELEIANGNGVNGMARRLQYLLEERGFKAVKITNANTFEHITTKIFYYNGHRTDVDRLIQEIAFCPDERNIIELKNFGRRIKIIIGKDIIMSSQFKPSAGY